MSPDISNLSLVEKRALLAQLLKQKAERPKAPSPLSYGQRAWWFLYQLEPQNPAYNIMMPVRVLSDVDHSVLHRTFERLVERHASLRTYYTLREGNLVQQVQEEVEVDYENVDASAWDEQRLKEAVAEEVHRAFDLERAQPFRARLYTISKHEHVLTMVVHHIAFDLWSLVLFVHELSVLYAAEKDRQPSPLAPLKFHYTDFVQRQLKAISGAEGERLWNYWRDQLSGELPVLNLPTCRTRPAVQTHRGAARRFTISPELSDRLKTLSQTNGTTLYMTLLAAYEVLLHRYSGQSDIIVGSLSAVGRNHAEFAGLVGFFDNQIALRADLSRNPTFEQFLAQVRQTVLGALKHQDYPFPLLVERLQPERDTSRSPIFQTMFILQRAQMPEESDLLRLSLGVPDVRVQLGELTFEPVEFERRVAGGLAGQLDLTLIAAEVARGLECSLQYNPDVLDDETAAQMTRHFQNLLESIVAEPSRSVGTLAMLSEDERRRSIVEWNDTEVEIDLECLHLMFEKQAEREPAATAVVFRGQRMTYGELNQRANKLAHYLRSLGVGPEVRVGICFERSQEMLVAVLGILKAGGAYVPLDPNYPADRLAFMLEDACVRVLLTQQHLAERLPACGARVVRLDSDEIDQFDDANPSPLTTIGNLAYIIYTSGSTGQPKGVMIDHRGAANTIVDMNERYRVGPDDRVLALSSLSFDLSVYDMLGTLAAGATIVVPSPSSGPDPSDWLDLIEREQVTVWNSAPALMEVFAEYVSGRSVSMPHSLRVVLMSGDWIPVKLPEQIKTLAANEQIEVHSLGGATEASIWSITFPIKSVDPAWKSIPYGLPMVNQQFHVLDAFLQPTPIGVVGELYIGGIGLALGYHNRQQLTAEKFIPDPFSTQPDARLYRTGDLGRRMPDGNIEFLGRIDGQVKISGYRIELGEIETALGQHASVREAVVKTYVAASGEKRLAAYVVPKQQVEKAELRDHLRGRLPEFMVPAAFVMIDELPLTPNGKVDQRALPAPEQAVLDAAEHSFVAPRNPTEEVLAGLWCQVLHRDRVGAEENFFESGGDSLLATQLISRVRAAFEVELPLYCLFESPTVAGLAMKIDVSMSDGRTTSAASHTPLRRAARNGHMPLSYAQQRLWFLDRLVPGNPFYNATAAVRLTGTLDRAVLERSLDEVIKRHESLRTTFLEVDGHAAQVIGDAWPVNVKFVDFTDRAPADQEEEIQRLATEETQRPFDLILGPLLRVVLVRLSEREHVLLLTLHHIIFDGWSFGILLSDTATLYEAALANKPSPLAELPVQYADFALWQREWLDGGVLEEQLGYWRRQLAGSSVLQLPTDRPRPASQTFRGARHLGLISTELAVALKELSSRHDATIYMTLLAAFKTLLHRYTGAEDVLVGSPIAGRTRAETEDLMGFFLNALPMRTDLSGDPAFTELLGRVRETTLGAYAHQDVPFEKLVEELRPERQITHTPFFRTWLVLQNAPMPRVELPGLSLSILQVDDGTSKFDLVLSMFETPEGLHATWIYNTDLFDAATVARMAGHFETLLRSIVERPETQLNALEIYTGAEKESRQREKSKREESNLKKLKSLRRSGVNLKQVSLTKTEYLAESETLPLVLRPAAEVNLADWARGNRDYIETELQRHGALLFRGFDLDSPARFEEFAIAVCEQLFTEYGDLPRQDTGSSRVYHSTPYPESSMILYHNESSHIHLWPLKIMFYCDTAARSGGETPVVDGRRVYRDLDPAIRRRFEEKRLMYVRNYKEGLDVQWQSFFGTDDRATVESYCRRAGIEFEWTADDGLRTRKVAQAVARHPRTGEMAFFNQMQAHHVSCLAPELRRSLLSLYDEEDLPRNVYYGDGTPIEDSVVDEVVDVYRRAASVFPWQVGDVLLVDNMLTAHARNPFVGPRKILVAMGDMVSHEGY
ncbi:MAG TPA: amino acid adenylation domain-containing protein [Pyrinomonadaceae bacterium]|nr:amino acid adenylation domain-containing protein [Pyrinomonadaceae bacterium]